MGSQNPLLLKLLTTLQQRHLLLTLSNHLLLLLLLLLLSLRLLRLLRLRRLLWLLGRLCLGRCTLLVSGLLRCRLRSWLRALLRLLLLELGRRRSLALLWS